jgi:hypothetical protein
LFCFDLRVYNVPSTKMSRHSVEPDTRENHPTPVTIGKTVVMENRYFFRRRRTPFAVIPLSALLIMIHFFFIFIFCLSVKTPVECDFPHVRDNGIFNKVALKRQRHFCMISTSRITHRYCLIFLSNSFLYLFFGIKKAYG